MQNTTDGTPHNANTDCQCGRGSHVHSKLTNAEWSTLLQKFVDGAQLRAPLPSFGQEFDHDPSQWKKA